MANTDLSKVVFNPSKSFTFQPVQRKQQASLEITNNSTSAVMVKFKNTNPSVFSTVPKLHNLGIGEKFTFKCNFRGLAKEKCKKNDRYTVVLIAVSKNANMERIKGKEHSTATLKHMIHIVYPGVNDEKENQQPTQNDDEEDKDRKGRMRAKTKVEAPAAQVKKAKLIFLTRPEEESVSDEDEGGLSLKSDAPPPSDDMMTTRPAGFFNGQVVSNGAPGGAPGDDMRTTRPAGQFTGQQVGGASADPKSAGMMTTRNAGAFNGQVMPNQGGEGGEALKTTKQAGSYENPQQKNK
ncbi:hypothetical protein L5515_002694 [Caenorhabditis briggsae]|uniref:Major sperm protein n=1 Tax=Caenorhabditis briggsae TaxID=6238 RepID=A0AAE9E4N5_CAEBR|nr:hypothetical protein L3Y34_016619 [Caenorhabditis briggsae]UMM15148.1 hypothetical protein L5515_002694 [Caenorhabditis briggsae]